MKNRHHTAYNYKAFQIEGVNIYLEIKSVAKNEFRLSYVYVTAHLI